jgi:hypothetical protein
MRRSASRRFSSRRSWRSSGPSHEWGPSSFGDTEAGYVAQIIVVAPHKAGCEADGDKGSEAG